MVNPIFGYTIGFNIGGCSTADHGGGCDSCEASRFRDAGLCQHCPHPIGLPPAVLVCVVFVCLVAARATGSGRAGTLLLRYQRAARWQPHGGFGPSLLRAVCWPGRGLDRQLHHRQEPQSVNEFSRSLAGPCLLRPRPDAGAAAPSRVLRLLSHSYVQAHCSSYLLSTITCH